MKKITSVFTLALLLAGAAPATSFADVKPKYAMVNDEHVVLDLEHPLISAESQITSPYTEASEGSIAGMIDNDATTFWHSAWAGGNVAAGLHYFQVELTEDNIESVAFKFTRRAVVNDHIIQWGVYGTNNPDADKESCVRLATIQTPFKVNNETLTSGLFTIDGNKYLRFYQENCHPNNRGYFHVAEFQLYASKRITDEELAEVKRQAALDSTLAILQEYLPYMDNLTAGTAPGQYDAEAIAAFQAALDAASVIDGPEGDALTTEQLKKIGQDIKDTYEAVQKTKVPYAMTVADGYYFLMSPMVFTETTEDTEDPETGDVIPGETVSVIKSIYSNKTTTGISAKWKTFERTAPFLWKVTTRGDKQYELKNMGTNAKLTNIAMSTAVGMSLESDSLVVFDFNTEANGTIYYNIRLTSGKERGYQYVHLGGHGSGNNKEGNIVGWVETGGTGASEWMLVAVSDEDAQTIIDAYAPIAHAEERLIETKKMLTDLEPKLPIALDNSVKLERDHALISSADQITSPYTEANEGSIAGMIDNDATTFWHSAWAGGNVAAGLHYFQVELTETVPAAAFEFTRRNVGNDHITKWGVYGTNDTDAEKDACTKLAEISTPYGSSTETLVSDVFNVGNYQFLRFYAEATGSNRGYFHVAEFHLYPAEVIVNATSQAVAMGDVYNNAVTALNKAKNEGDEITVETYLELKAAYDAFIAQFVNPDTLRNKIAEKEEAVKMVVPGTNPGQWSEAGAASALNTLIENAKAYDAAGKYTLAESQKFVTDLDAEAENILAKANQVQENKWYRFRFASEALYDQNEWSKTGAAERTNTETGAITHPALYDKLVSVSVNVTTGEGTSAANHVELANIDDVAMGHGLRFIDEDEVLNHEDATLFRFIAIGDSAFIIQNKATNMFLGLEGRNATLGVAPISWNAKAMGFGKVNVHRNTATAINNNLHAQLSGSVLVTWETTNVASNTGFMIEEAEDVASDYEGKEFQISIAPNAYQSFCLPMDITAPEGEYIYGVEIEGTEVTLTRLENNTAAAGEPFIFIQGTPENYDASVTDEPNYTFKHGYTVVSEPKTVGKHVGTFTTQSVPAGNVLVGRKNFSVTAMTASVAAYRSYIKAELAAEDQITVNTSEEIFNSIQDTVAKAAKGGDIYTIDGKYVGKGDLKSKLNKGIYIINGVKVIVK